MEPVAQLVGIYVSVLASRSMALAKGWLRGRARRKADLEHLFCVEVVAITYSFGGQTMRSDKEFAP